MILEMVTVRVDPAPVTPTEPVAVPVVFNVISPDESVAVLKFASE